jgi:hypothetical protein
MVLPHPPPPAQRTLNLRRISHINPRLLAVAQLNGQFDYNQTPIAPPGIQVVIHEKPDDRNSNGTPTGQPDGPPVKPLNITDAGPFVIVLGVLCLIVLLTGLTVFTVLCAGNFCGVEARFFLILF